MTATLASYSRSVSRLVALAPLPRVAPDDTRRAESSGGWCGAEMAWGFGQVQVEELLPTLVEVAAWTSGEGAWQEHATFLLRTGDGALHHVAFNEPDATKLVSWLRTRPGFDSGLLLELLGETARRIIPLWCGEASQGATPLS